MLFFSLWIKHKFNWTDRSTTPSVLNALANDIKIDVISIHSVCSHFFYSHSLSLVCLRCFDIFRWSTRQDSSEQTVELIEFSFCLFKSSKRYNFSPVKLHPINNVLQKVFRFSPWISIIDEYVHLCRCCIFSLAKRQIVQTKFLLTINACIRSLVIAKQNER